MKRRVVPCVDGSELARTFLTPQAWSVQPCVRPVCAVHMTAGHNALRGSGPGQKPAFENAVACVDGSGLARTFFTPQAWSVQPCVRPVCAVHMTAGHNALRGSGPGQKPAFENAVACVDGSGLARTFFTPPLCSALPFFRPVCAVHMTAGHNALRGSGPGQKPAFENAVACVD